MNLNQATLPAVDVAATAAFYQRLGFRLIVDALPRYVRFECPEGDATLSIEQVLQRGTEPGAIMFFECRCLDETVDRLRAAGIEFDTLPTDQPWLWREARLRDPAGNPLCLFSAGPNRRSPPWRVAQAPMADAVTTDPCQREGHTRSGDEPGGPPPGPAAVSRPGSEPALRTSLGDPGVR